MPAVQIGLKNLVYSLLSSDNVGSSVSYLTPVPMIGAISANINPNSSMETLFGDDGPMETATALGKIDLELTVGDMPLDVQAAILGHSVVNGVLIRKSGDVPPWLAIGFKTIKSNGKYRYVWLLKGKFSMPELKNETKSDKISFVNPVIKGSFVKRDFDDAWIKQADEDTAEFTPAAAAAWFTNVEGVVDMTAPTVAVVPADAATAVSATSSVVWTFSKPICATYATNYNFFVYKDTDKSNVPGSVSINAAGTSVTFKPTSNLTTAAKYVSVCTADVTDLFGNGIASNKVAAFTVA